jgi:hypothetical protein
LTTEKQLEKGMVLFAFGVRRGYPLQKVGGMENGYITS